MSNVADVWTEIPVGWPTLPEGMREHVRDRALNALRLGGDRPVQERLRFYYDIDGDYAGASFAQLEPNDREDLTATDLHATRLLSVPIGAGATRRFLDSGAARMEVLVALRAIPDAELLTAGPATFEAMETLYLAVKSNLSAASTKHPDAWVTASKLCARKRSALFPVRDRNVSGYLGLTQHNSYKVAWQVFRYLIGEHAVIEAIAAAEDATRGAAAGTRLRLDIPGLRILDAAIWTDTLRPA